MPDGFTMSVKAHRGLSHFRRLAHPEPWIDRVEAAQRALGGHAGAVLVQLRSDMARDDARLEDFLAMVPDWIRIAMELRHPSWNHPAVDDILTRHGAAYVVTSGLGLACIPKATTDFVYIRMHGPDTDPGYAGSYADHALRRWAQQVTEWSAQRRRVLVYFNNDGDGTRVALRVRGDSQRMRFCGAPALSLVPDARAPPNGCCPTTAPVGLSLM